MLDYLDTAPAHFQTLQHQRLRQSEQSCPLKSASALIKEPNAQDAYAALADQRGVDLRAHFRTFDVPHFRSKARDQALTHELFPNKRASDQSIAEDVDVIIPEKFNYFASDISYKSENVDNSSFSEFRGVENGTSRFAELVKQRYQEYRKICAESSFAKKENKEQKSVSLLNEIETDFSDYDSLYTPRQFKSSVVTSVVSTTHKRVVYRSNRYEALVQPREQGCFGSPAQFHQKQAFSFATNSTATSVYNGGRSERECSMDRDINVVRERHFVRHSFNNNVGY